MPRDFKTMPSTQLRNEGLVFVGIGVGAFTIFLTVLLCSDKSMGVLILAAMANFAGLLCLVSGIVFLLLLAARKKDWQPDYSLKNFDPDRFQKQLEANLVAESGGVVTEAAYCCELLGPPKDPRTFWNRFLTSSAPIFVVYSYEIAIRCGARKIVVTTKMGRTVDNPRASIVEISLVGNLVGQISTPTGWTGTAFVDNQGAPTKLVLERKLAKLMNSVLVTRYRGEIGFVDSSTTGFNLIPAATGTLAVLTTLPQEFFGGFRHKFGILDFVTILNHLEKQV